MSQELTKKVVQKQEVQKINISTNMIPNNRSSKIWNLKSNIDNTKDVDHDEIFEGLYYNNLNQCGSNDKATYNVVIVIFSSKYKSIISPTLYNI